MCKVSFVAYPCFTLLSCRRLRFRSVYERPWTKMILSAVWLFTRYVEKLALDPHFSSYYLELGSYVKRDIDSDEGF